MDEERAKLVTSKMLEALKTTDPLTNTEAYYGLVSLGVLWQSPELDDDLDTKENLVKTNEFLVKYVPPDKHDAVRDWIAGTLGSNERAETATAH
ncbi:hypothetical protein AB4Z51_13415 [Bradyrhizobium sp. 2TAF36]|uniref:hypothetical protein n=1 Tax=Bradyrhizobium sp. 2TAF36 TaxID=3233016 RepID=UPI003F8E3C5A